MNQISYEERVEVYKEALKQYGQEMQMVVAIEELAECQKEICKVLRGKGILDHLAEEIADATIMLEQLRLMHDIDELACQEMDEKVERLSDRLGMREDEVNKETAKMIWVPMLGKEY